LNAIFKTQNAWLLTKDLQNKVKNKVKLLNFYEFQNGKPQILNLYHLLILQPTACVSHESL